MSPLLAEREIIGDSSRFLACDVKKRCHVKGQTAFTPSEPTTAHLATEPLQPRRQTQTAVP